MDVHFLGLSYRLVLIKVFLGYTQVECIRKLLYLLPFFGCWLGKHLKSFRIYIAVALLERFIKLLHTLARCNCSMAPGQAKRLKRGRGGMYGQQEGRLLAFMFLLGLCWAA